MSSLTQYATVRSQTLRLFPPSGVASSSTVDFKIDPTMTAPESYTLTWPRLRPSGTKILQVSSNGSISFVDPPPAVNVPSSVTVSSVTSQSGDLSIAPNASSAQNAVRLKDSNGLNRVVVNGNQVDILSQSGATVASFGGSGTDGVTLTAARNAVINSTVSGSGFISDNIGISGKYAVRADGEEMFSVDGSGVASIKNLYISDPVANSPRVIDCVTWQSLNCFLFNRANPSFKIPVVVRAMRIGALCLLQLNINTINNSPSGLNITGAVSGAGFDMELTSIPDVYSQFSATGVDTVTRPAIYTGPDAGNVVRNWPYTISLTPTYGTGSFSVFLSNVGTTPAASRDMSFGTPTITYQL